MFDNATQVRRGILMTATAVTMAAFPAALHSVSVSPMAVYLNERSRTGTMTLFNGGTQPEEIRIDFAFGYPQSDADGNLSVPLSDVAPEGEPSAVPWLSAFPRRVVLQPGQRQVVRVIARPPADLPRGEFWARALIHSRGGTPPIESVQRDVGVELEVQTVVVVAVNYRNGAVDTGLDVAGADVRLQRDEAVATIDLERTGNAAFLGRILVEALDENGRALGSSEQVLAVYRTLRRRIPVTLPDGSVPARLRFTMDTDRADLPPGGALPCAPTVYEVPLHSGS